MGERPLSTSAAARYYNTTEVRRGIVRRRGGICPPVGEAVTDTDILKPDRVHDLPLKHFLEITPVEISGVILPGAPAKNRDRILSYFGGMPLRRLPDSLGPITPL